eukprot:Amastigsp_a174885_2141.p2 type:complete len:247 gc:universal Amastigsp_a174885_2141:854-114(-)
MGAEAIHQFEPTSGVAHIDLMSGESVTRMPASNLRELSGEKICIFSDSMSCLTDANGESAASPLDGAVPEIAARAKSVAGNSADELKSRQNMSSMIGEISDAPMAGASRSRWLAIESETSASSSGILSLVSPNGAPGACAVMGHADGWAKSDGAKAIAGHVRGPPRGPGTIAPNGASGSCDTAGATGAGAGALVAAIETGCAAGVRCAETTICGYAAQVAARSSVTWSRTRLLSRAVDSLSNEYIR